MKNALIEEAPVAESQLGPKRRYLLTALATESEPAIKLISQAITDAGGDIEKTEDLGSRALAYPINKKSQLNLVSVFFSGQTDQTKAIETALSRENGLERYLLTAWREDPHKESPKRRPRTNV